MKISEGVNSPLGSYIISALFGLGLAALFRKACVDKSCVVIKGPNSNETNKFYYKIQDDCYKYTPIVTECDE